MPEDQIAYVGSNVDPGPGICTRTFPCSGVFQGLLGLNGRLHMVLLPGVYNSRYSVNTPGLFIHGTGAILVQGAQIPGFILQIDKPAIIRGVTFSGSLGASLGVYGRDIVLDSITLDGHESFLQVSRGGSSPAASVTVRNLVMKNSGEYPAIRVDSVSELILDGATITGGAVGIQAEPGAKVQLKNLLITGTRRHALDLAGATGEIEFATIADAGAMTPAPPCAVTCNPNLRITSSIIWQQTCSGVPGDAAGACTFRSSIVSNAPVPGITNVDPQFVDPLAGDYHLKPTSPAKDAVDVGPVTDFEGDPRPRGPRFDLGADEAP